MSLECEISEPHERMLEELREVHGEEIDAHLRTIVEAEIHESYQQMRGSPGPE